MRTPDFWRRDATSPWPAMLAPAAWLYGIGRRIDAARMQPAILSRPIVSIGNLVAGGAGKTPVAIAVAGRLAALGHRPACITRGYGGTLAGPVLVDPLRDDAGATGDEALLLAQAAPTWIARDRVTGARAALAAGADVLVLDDAHQNGRLAKDLSLLVIDSEYGIGNGRLLPAGPLREPAGAGLARADAVILLGRATLLPPELATDKPVLHATLQPGPEMAELRSQPLLAFAGIARPEKFFATLRDHGCTLAEALPFPDHHPYDEDAVMRLIERAASLGALPVTTTKDHVRLPKSAQPMVKVLTVAAAFTAPEALDRLLVGLF